MARGIDRSSHLLQLVPRWLVFFTGWSGYPAAAWARNRSAICSVFGRISGIFLYPPTGQIFGYVFDGYRPFVRYSGFGIRQDNRPFLVSGYRSDIWPNIRHFLVSGNRPDVLPYVRYSAGYQVFSCIRFLSYF